MWKKGKTKGEIKALFDTNFLLIPGKFKVDIFSEMKKFGRPKFYTIDLVVKEMEKIAESKGKTANYARLGLKLIKFFKIKVLKTSGKYADEEIIKIAKKGFVICTQDAELIKKLKRQGAIVFILRQKKFLEKV